MSLDLAWDKLDDTLATRLVEVLNRQLAAVERPSFIGPVEVTAIDFGTVRPDVQIVDMRDIYRDFLEDDEDSAPNAVSPEAAAKISGALSDGFMENSANMTGASADDDFEWVSRRVAQHGMAHDAPVLHHLPPHGPQLRYGARSQSSDFLSSFPGMHYSRDLWGGGASSPGMMGMNMNMPNVGLGDPLRRPGLGSLQGMGMGMGSSLYATRAPSPLVSPLLGSMDPGVRYPNTSGPIGHSLDQDDSRTPSPETNANSPTPNPNPHPDLQLHLRVLYHSDVRLSLNTSLLINYPSPMFMTLPIKLCVTGFLFDGEVVLAYEGSRRRVHFCILDDLDPYGPAGDRPKRNSSSNSESSTPPEGIDAYDPAARPTKPLPVGQRLLPQIFIESEIGQADKHILKNVTRVEKFIQDVIRKTVEDELVFPNFHTLILGDS